MARMNQMSGRTAQAWKARYKNREQITVDLVEKLQVAGYNAVAVQVAAGGPGIPGGITYRGAIEIDGKRICKREAMGLIV